MKCKHCGKDSEEETRYEAAARHFREELEKEKSDPEGYRAQQMREVERARARGCSFMNYVPGRIAIFEPRGGGSYGYIYGSVADELWELERNPLLLRPYPPPHGED